MNIVLWNGTSIIIPPKKSLTRTTEATVVYISHYEAIKR